MPHYFLHIRDGDSFVEDLEGTGFDDLDAARLEAVAAAREILAEKIVAGEEVDGQWFEICDAEGRVLDKVVFRDVMKLPGSDASS